jgi:hypothetical protein
MLEHPLLLVRPGLAGTRAVFAADAARALGGAHWQPRPAWRRLTRRVLAVHEQEDHPLLFTVRRAWSLLPTWEVRDADGRPVGRLLGGSLWDARGYLLAVRRPLPEGAWAYCTPAGLALAELLRDAAGVHIAFGEAAVDPFARMLVLAAALLETVD